MIKVMTIDDYDALFLMWKNTPNKYRECGYNTQNPIKKHQQDTDIQKVKPQESRIPADLIDTPCYKFCSVCF